MDEAAQKDFTDRPSTEEFERHKKNWFVSLNTSGRNALMKLRLDFSEAGEERLAPILSGNIRNGIRRLLHPAHHGGSGMTTCGAHKTHRSQVSLSS